MTEWPFKDSPNVAAIINRKVVEGNAWIAFVSHDVDDGAWQFHVEDRAAIPTEKDALVVSLREVVDLDPTVRELASLPYGWHAWRRSKNSPWQRQRTESK
jgi:hypothetical protein